MLDDITLEIDRAAAEDLRATLYEVREHVAAGAPITPPIADEISAIAAPRTATT